MVLFKPLVLDGDGCILQILGDVLQIRPDAVLVHVQRLVHDPLLRVGILIVQLRGDLRLELVQIDLRLAAHGAVDIRHEDTGEDGRCQHEYQQQRSDDMSRPAPAASLMRGHAAHTLLGTMLQTVSALDRLCLYVSGTLPKPSR